MGFEVWVLSPAMRRALPQVARHLELSVPPAGLLARVARRLLSALVVLLGLSRATHQLAAKLQWSLIGGKRHEQILQRTGFAVVIIEDLSLLTPVLAITGQTSAALYDAREYSPREFEGSPWFRFFLRPRVVRTLRRELPRLHGLYTVCDALAHEYAKDFGVAPAVVRSVPPYNQAPSRPAPTAPLRMVHHGNANADRGLDQMLEVVKRLEGRYTLDLYLVGSARHIRYLQQVAGGSPWIRFRDPVPFDRLMQEISQYDIGFYLLQPTGFNTLHALPNKFFEFIQARLALAVGPSPEMATLVRAYGIGVVSANFSVDAMVEQLRALSVEDVSEFQRATAVAAEDLSWERESERLRSVVARAIARRGRA